MSLKIACGHNYLKLNIHTHAQKHTDTQKIRLVDRYRYIGIFNRKCSFLILSMPRLSVEAWAVSTLADEHRKQTAA